MYAIAVRTTIHDVEAGLTFLREEVVPRVSQAPGFVAGYWVRVAEDKGASMLVFESEEAARAAAERIVPPEGGAVTPDSVAVGEVVAHA
jgi:hypothetical protein